MGSSPTTRELLHRIPRAMTFLNFFSKKVLCAYPHRREDGVSISSPDGSFTDSTAVGTTTNTDMCRRWGHMCVTLSIPFPRNPRHNMIHLSWFAIKPSYVTSSRTSTEFFILHLGAHHTCICLWVSQTHLQRFCFHLIVCGKSAVQLLINHGSFLPCLS